MKLYAVKSGDGRRIKIGISADPQRRIANLQTAHGDKLEVLAIVEGGREREARLHRRLRKSRTSGEWFRADCARVLSAVAELVAEVALMEENRTAAKRAYLANMAAMEQRERDESEQRRADFEAVARADREYAAARAELAAAASVAAESPLFLLVFLPGAAILAGAAWSVLRLTGWV